MDDSCAVCAETLEWVAYGQCGHREVCSTCVARLRFICDDQNCCLCKSSLNVMFVTKALGDYTNVISDFKVFPSEPKEGKVGSYWYHEGTQSFFDDPDHYKMIKAMCRLSCIVCDKMDEQGSENFRRRNNFKNVEQLKDHLLHRHKLIMCNLCLEGRKIFICEQNLYTREQLNQHINTGDSEVDGSEAERGGFKGHPMCEFCRNPFYGENELYTHMSTEHYTCHICQRQHPGHYEYYRNYDELEVHFRRDHMLCEDEGCLAKKFIVFSTETEMKKHNAMEHGGRMSRSKRNATLQIPTSFRFERSIEQDHRRRGCGFRSEHSESELSRAVQASLETTNTNNATSSGFQAMSNFGGAVETNSKFRPLELLSSTDSEPSPSYHLQQEQPSINIRLEKSSFPPLPGSTRSKQQILRSKAKVLGKNTNTNNATSSGSQAMSNFGGAVETNSKFRPLELLTNTDSEPSPSYHLQQGQPSINIRQEKSSFPPLPGSTIKQENLRGKAKVLGKNTMVARLSRQNNVVVLHSGHALASGDLQPTASSSSVLKSQVLKSQVLKSQAKSTSGSASFSASASSTSKTTDKSTIVRHNNTTTGNKSVTDSEWVTGSSGRSSSINGTTKMNHNLGARVALDGSRADFPPISVTNTKKMTPSNQPLLKLEDAQAANKTLVEKIRADLLFDEDRYSVFKFMSGEYRRGLTNTGEYVTYVHQFGLSHHLPELARLCPDPQKQKELLEACKISLGNNGPSKNSADINSSRSKQNNISKKGKEKLEGVENKNSGLSLADIKITGARELHPSHSTAAEEVEILSKDGYRSIKGKSKVSPVDTRTTSSSFDQASTENATQNDPASVCNSSKKAVEGNKPRKKTSKFHRVRLGEDSPAAVIGLAHSESTPDLSRKKPGQSNDVNQKMPVGGVWRNGGGQKLVANLR